MKQNKLLIVFTLLIITGALYRIIPGRPFGFEPMIAMALFGGAVIANKKWAFAIPLAAMLLSDLMYEALTRAGVVNMPGFYDGQWMNYLLLAGVAGIGIGMKRINVANVALSAIAAPVLFYILSNTGVWAMGGGYQRPITGAGYIQAMADGLPFLKYSILGCACFSTLLFGSWALIGSARTAQAQGTVA